MRRPFPGAVPPLGDGTPGRVPAGAVRRLAGGGAAEAVPAPQADSERAAGGRPETNTCRDQQRVRLRTVVFLVVLLHFLSDARLTVEVLD